MNGIHLWSYKGEVHSVKHLKFIEDQIVARGRQIAEGSRGLVLVSLQRIFT